MGFLDSDIDPTMVAENCYNSIIQQVQTSNLNYQLQLSPFAALISLKKTPIKNKSGIPFPVKTILPCDAPRGEAAGQSHEVSYQEAKNTKLENELLRVKNEYAKAIDDYETVQEGSRTLVSNLHENIRNLTKENEELKARIEAQNNDIEVLNISNKTTKEVSNKLRKELSETKANFNKEKITIMKNHKTEIKHWRKQLGEQTKAKLKLENLETGKESKKKSTMNLAKKESNNNHELFATKSLVEDEVFCSICACLITNYCPEYFCGELFNPACAQCKDNSNDPFNSFPTPFQPPSLVSHWLLPYNDNLPQNPSSIASLRTHYVQLPSKSDEFIALKQDFLEIFEEIRAQMKTERNKMLEEFKTDIKKWFQ